MEVKMLIPNVDPWHLGMIPTWLEVAERSGHPTKDALNQFYAHGGGWDPFKGFRLADDNSLNYPGDPPQHPFAEFSFIDRPEKVYMYPHAWVAIIQPDRSFEVCRID